MYRRNLVEKDLDISILRRKNQPRKVKYHIGHGSRKPLRDDEEIERESKEQRLKEELRSRKRKMRGQGRDIGGDENAEDLILI